MVNQGQQDSVAPQDLMGPPTDQDPVGNLALGDLKDIRVRTQDFM